MKFKNVIKASLIVAVAVLIASCNRGGTGCPYELTISVDFLGLFM